ncbi:hypothetical protein GCM10010218_63110 [Streptomyces mashuensis]|uniref:DUF4397 domain-containing protein n=1 Tax=Streptomyces mashuensis TaxID=33904 RepID=A0A919B9J2_9ACTN|nr:hypothetical protein [Streptomyces mashuensis]GHF73342.1 hypothetical protein GCM10010218_63110 [Streptomyces mashuensis]
MIRIRGTAVTVVAVAGLMTAAPPAGATGTGEPGAPHGVHLLVNSAYGNRPGELVDIDLRGLKRSADVTVTSPLFPHRVHLTPYAQDGPGHHARPAIAMTVRPGTYPLRVHAGGRVVAQERVEVTAARRPEFQVGTDGDVLRPGERLGVSYDDLYPGEQGEAFTVTSPAFRKAVRLTHDPAGGHWNNPRMFTALTALPPDVKDGTYKVTLTGDGGRPLAEKPLTVRAARPGDSDYVGRARGPAFFPASGRPETARSHGQTAAAGGTVNVLWRDSSPDPGEDERLTATSPAFEQPVPLRRDDSKAGDGDVPRYYGPARVRKDLGAGRYPVTVISHHGRVKRTAHLLVDAVEPAAATTDGPRGTTLLAVGGTGLAAVLATAGALTLRRRTAHGT